MLTQAVTNNASVTSSLSPDLNQTQTYGSLIVPMPKRKAAIEEDVSCNSDGSDISERKKKTAHRKQPIIRQMSESTSDSDDSDKEKPLSKKSKKTKTDQSMVRMAAP